MDVSSCQNIEIALYPHIVPVVLAMFLSAYTLIKARRSKLSLIFFSFCFSFSLWLVGDFVAWTSAPYGLIYFVWSWLDFVNIVFFILGAYFFSVLARDKITTWENIIYISLCLPAFIITVSGASVLEFTQPVCEAVNSNLLTNYKLAVEGLVVVLMFASLLIAWRKSDFQKRIRLVAVLSAILLFFTVFAGTEYFSSISGIYEVNLYSLFILPVFLIVMVFAVTNLGLFDFRLLGTQILSYILILMSGLQLLFVQDSTHATLSVITLAISIFFGVLLLQNAKKEESVRLEVERLAEELKVTNARQETLMHFVGHEVKGFLTKDAWAFASLSDGDFGALPETAKPFVEAALKQSRDGVRSVTDILTASNQKKGTMSYSKEPFDLKTLIEGVVEKEQAMAKGKNLTLTFSADEGDYTMSGDKEKVADNVFRNIIENSIHYTPAGSITASLKKENNKLIFSITDTGVGITDEDKKNLFTEGGHGKDSQKVNVHSTGYDLYKHYR